MTISLCTITKNEEENIDRCLKSVKSLVDEMIVVDTGSEDETVKVAEDNGAKVYHFEWINDFSAAKNYALSKANGNWIIFLDADEYIVQEEVEAIKDSIKKAIALKAECIVSKLINCIPNETLTIQSVTTTVRIFKRDKKIKYRGAIHETIQHQEHTLSAFRAEDFITIYHTGYAPEEMQRKNKGQRNLDLLYKKLEQIPTDSLTHFYIGESLMIASDYEEAVQAFNKAIMYNDNNKFKALGHQMYCNLLACMLVLKYDMNEMKQVQERAMQYDVKCPDFHYYMGQRYLQEQDVERFIEEYEWLLQKVQDYEYGFESKVIGRLINIYQQMRDIYTSKGNLAATIQLCIQLLRIDLYDYKSLLILIKTLMIKETDDIIYEFCFKLYNANKVKDILYLVRVTESLKAWELHKRFKKHLSIEHIEIYEKNKYDLSNDEKSFAKEIEGLEVREIYNWAQFYNTKGDIKKAIYFHNKAFELDKNLAKIILPETHINYNYEYAILEEVGVEYCPLCGHKGVIHSVYNCIQSVDFIKGFNPIRVWMECENCSHLFANNYPKDLSSVVQADVSVYNKGANLSLLHRCEDSILNIKGYVKGNNLLEVGVGGGEMLAVALEHGFKVVGVDLRKNLAQKVEQQLGIRVMVEDFMTVDIEEKYDVVCLGDVLEHLTEPKLAIKKIKNMLNSNGIVWISTPNFKSAFSRLTKHNDPMWRVVEHINYFSYDSINKLLVSYGFTIKNYRMSKRYNGSMEVIAQLSE